MDRNAAGSWPLGMNPVALRKESVDRNRCLLVSAFTNFRSLSARRAWIEITYVARLPRAQVSSLSARRAWIEMRVRSYS